MKKILIPQLLIMQMFLHAQFYISTTLDDQHLTYFHQIKKTNNLTRVVDSIINFSFSTQWDPVYKTYVISRHSNTGLPYEFLEDVYEQSTQSWVRDMYITENFFLNRMRSELCKIKFNSFAGIFKDTIQYIKLLPYLDPFGDSMFQYQITTSYNTTIQSITSGYKYIASIYHDSLYEYVISFGYNTATSSYDIPYYYYMFTYNTDNLIQLATRKAWNTISNQYENDYRIFYQYDTQKRKSFEIQQVFSSVWKNVNKKEYFYNQQGNIICEKRYMANFSNEFEPQQMDSIIYDANNNIIKKTTFTWDNGLNQWKYQIRTTINYNQNLKTFIFSETWNGTQWIPANRSTYTYNAANKITSYEYEYYHVPTSTWRKNWKDTYIYDATDTNLLAHTSYYSYNYVDYTPSSQDLYVLNNMKEDSIHYLLYYNTTTSQWDSITKSVYYWSTWNANTVSDISSTSFILYPNPCNEWIQLISSDPVHKIEVCDLTGKVLMYVEKNNTRVHTINTSYLQPGNYILLITDQHGNKLTRPIIKL